MPFGIVPILRKYRGKGDLEVRFSEIGDISAKNTVDIASKVSGRIIELSVQEGDRVKTGQKLAVIQPGKTGAERFLPSTVVSPIEGTLIRYIKNPDSSNQNAAFAEKGEYVTGIFESQNPTFMMTVADMRTVIVKLKINEMDILKLREEMPVKVSVDALPEMEFPATVSMISPQAEKDPRGGKVFRVEVTLDKNDPRLRTGMTARVDALLEKREGVLKIPLTGLFEERGVPLVYLDVPGGKPRQAVIGTGLKTELDVEVTTGLEEGQKVHTEKPVIFDELPKDELKKAMAGKGDKLSKKQQRDMRRKARRARRGARIR